MTRKNKAQNAANLAPGPGAVLLSSPMKHRDVEFTDMQGIGRQLWKWSAWLGHFHLQGQAATKAEAIAEAVSLARRALLDHVAEYIVGPTAA